MSEKYKYLAKKPMVIINKMLGYSKQAIRTTSPNHEPLLHALNYAIGEAIEKVVYKFSHKYKYRDASDNKNKRNKR